MPAPDFGRTTPLIQPAAPQFGGGLGKIARLAWQDVQRTFINRIYQPAADPTNSEWIHKQLLDHTFRLNFGRVVGGIPYVNYYRIQQENTGATIWATPAATTGMLPIGQKQIFNVPIGSHVIVAVHPQDTHGYILHVLPTFQVASDRLAPDVISQAGRSGLLVEPGHQYPFSFPHNGLIKDYSCGGAIDRTMTGENVSFAETGIGTFSDQFMAFLRVDEETGLWCFYHDQLTRLAGHNLQLWTAGSEQEDLDDEGEYNKVLGHCAYYWEALGAFTQPTTVSRDIPTNSWQHDPDCQFYSQLEPCNDHQVPWFRLRDFYGYLGQAHKRHLCLPKQCDAPAPPAATGNCNDGVGCGDINILGQLDIYPGVYEENLAVTGRKVIRTAHELIIAKHLLIPSPKLIKKPEDPNGDKTANYKAAGALGSGPSHLVEGEIAVTGGDNPLLVTAAGFMDTHAFVFEWIGNHPFHYHTLDYYLPEEDELAYFDSCSAPDMPPPPFEELKCYQYLEQPAPIPLTVDHRYQEVNYYPNNSYIALLANGGIAIGDGYGAEFRITAGSTWITNPGDLYIESGRNLNVLAGYDTCIRAKNCVDISATLKDVRIKAEDRLWLVATGECGGILIESMATAPFCDTTTDIDNQILGGILIKAPDSMITHFAKNMCFKLSNADDDSDADNNVLIFDTGWAGRIRTRSRYIENFLRDDGAILDFWIDESDDSVVMSNEKWQNVVTFCQKVRINDGVLINGCLATNGNIVSINGHIATTGSEDFSGLVGVIQDTEDLETQFDNLETRCETELPEDGVDELAKLDERVTDFCCTDPTFRFRNTEQYRTEDWVFFENRWQQLARISGMAVGTWTEQAVNTTYPYPGKQKWLDETTYRRLDFKLWDSTTGIAVDRGALYETPSFNTPTTHIPDGNYLVII